MKRVRVGSLVVGVLAMSLVLTGCPDSKAKKGAAGPGAGLGLSESNRGGGSLGQYRDTGRGAEGGPLQDVHFDYDRYDLSSEARSTLQGNAEWLKQNSAAKVEIEGHCDSRGTVEYNLALGAKRAKSVKDYLTSLGIPGDRLSTISYGEELPICQEETEDCMSRNRRVHSVVLQ